MKHRAFTHWEALVVMAIVLIGVAILVPLRNFKREDARRSSCSYNLKIIGLAFLQYTGDYDEKFPPVAVADATGWSSSLQPYTKSWTFFQCVSEAKGGAPYATDYYYNAHLEFLKRGNIKSSTLTILSGDGTGDKSPSYHLSQLPAAWRTDENSPAWRHLDGANYLFVDGHVKWFKPQKIFGAPDAATPTFEVK